MRLIIEDDEGHKTVVPIVRDDIEISIGRLEGSYIRLTDRNVSRKHAKLIRRQGTFYVEDLHSYNGIKVNGNRIDGRIEIAQGDLIQIGDYELVIQPEQTAAVPHTYHTPVNPELAETLASHETSATAVSPIASTSSDTAQLADQGLHVAQTENAGRDTRPLMPAVSPNPVARDTRPLAPAVSPEQVAHETRPLTPAVKQPLSNPPASDQPSDPTSSPALRQPLNQPMAPSEPLEPSDADITAQFERPKRKSGPMILASSIGLVCLLGGGTWLLLHRQSQPLAEIGDQPSAPSANAASARPRADEHAPVPLTLTPEPAPVAVAEPAARATAAKSPPRAPPHPTETLDKTARPPLVASVKPMARPAAVPLAVKPPPPAAAALPDDKNGRPKNRAEIDKERRAQAQLDFSEGASLLFERRYPEAINSLERALEKDRSLVDAHLGLGRAYQALGNTDRAVPHFEEFVHAAPRHPRAAEISRMLQEYYRTTKKTPRYRLTLGSP